MDTRIEIDASQADAAEEFEGAVNACLVQLDAILEVGERAHVVTLGGRELELPAMAREHGLDLDELAFRVALYRVSQHGRRLASEAVYDAANKPGPTKAGAP